MSYLNLQNITFTYEDDNVPVIKDFSLEINAGDCVLVLGDNGSGKSTLFRILNGLSFPEKGFYTFKDQKINSKFLKDNINSKKFHKAIGYLFQNPDIMLFNSNVYDELAFGPRQLGLSDEEIKNRVNDLLTLFDIENIKEKASYHLSGGQKKKVALAAVMSLNPEVIILDEPLSGLDRKSQEWLLSFFKDLKDNGKTLIISTHNEEMLKDLANRVISLPC